MSLAHLLFRRFFSTHRHIPPTSTSPSSCTVITLPHSLKLVMGNEIPNLQMSYCYIKKESSTPRPLIYLFPSMSHSAHFTRAKHQRHDTKISHGWWEDVCGWGNGYGIDMEKYDVLCAAPIGGPYGSSSPVTAYPSNPTERWGPRFPRITPADQAAAHAALMDALGIQHVHAIVGASMGGMQVLQFARMFPKRYSRVIAICTTAQTSPSTVALRSVQRATVRADAKFQHGFYDPADGPFSGMGLARMFGTICYRSRDEFDARFTWKPLLHHQQQQQQQQHTSKSSSSFTPLFDVESYLHHAASTFITRYDANCYLALSECMDLMDIGYGLESYHDGVACIPKDKELMLLPFDSDALIPAHEMEKLASVAGSQGKRVHMECISSIYGHDAFLKEGAILNPRIQHFLDPHVTSGVQNVRAYLHSTLAF